MPRELLPNFFVWSLIECLGIYRLSLRAKRISSRKGLTFIGALAKSLRLPGGGAAAPGAQGRDILWKKGIPWHFGRRRLSAADPHPARPVLLLQRKTPRDSEGIADSRVARGPKRTFWKPPPKNHGRNTEPPLKRIQK